MTAIVVEQPGYRLEVAANGLVATLVSPAGELVELSGIIYATIVKRLRWAGKPYPGADIECHGCRCHRPLAEGYRLLCLA